MTTDDPLKNWQLENREQDAEQWKLQETEQDLGKHMQLQPGQPEAYWQPIEYTRNPQARGRNWVLPSVLIVALLAVLGYVGWTAAGQMGISFGPDLVGMIPGMGAAAATATPTSAPVAAADTTQEATPTAEPTATSAPLETPTPTVEPTPTVAMAQLISGTVNAVGGVNARREPAITGELVELLNEGARVVVTRQEGEWSQVILPNGTTVAWVSSEFLDVTTQPVPLAELAALYATAGLPVPTPAPVALLPVPTPAAGAEITAEITGTAALTDSLLTGGPPDLTPNGVIPDAPFTNTLPLVGPALTVTDTTGVNARSEPSTTGPLIVVVPNGAVLPVTGRNAAGDWLQVQLPTGETGWMFADAVVASPDAQSAPVSAEAATSVLTDTAAEITPPLASGAPDGATATVTNELGANLRPAPSRTVDGVYVAAANESFALVGRSGDGEWVQVVLPDGSSAWALVTTVSLSVNLDALPVTQP